MIFKEKKWGKKSNNCSMIPDNLMDKAAYWHQTIVFFPNSIKILYTRTEHNS